MESPIVESQVSSKEFLINSINYFKNILKHWQWLLIALLIGTSYDLIMAKFNAPAKKYYGAIAFNLELEGSGGGANAMSGLAASLGLGGSGGTAVSGGLLGSANFESIVKSTKVFQNTFVKKVKIGNRYDYFINYYLDSSDIKKNDWAGGIFQSPSNYLKYKYNGQSLNRLNADDIEVFSQVRSKLIEATEINPIEKSSLMSFGAFSTNKLLTKAWLETLMKTTEEFYVEMKTQKSRQILGIQEKRLDSLHFLLKQNDRRLARYNFDNPLVVDPGGILNTQTTQRDNGYLSSQYYAQLTAVESLKRMIIEQTPIFTILEPVRFSTSNTKIGFSQRINGVVCLIIAIIIISLLNFYNKMFH